MLRKDRMQIATTAALRGANLTNERGDLLTSFRLEGNDSMDFASVSRSALKQMLEHAYCAGMRDATVNPRK